MELVYFSQTPVSFCKCTWHIHKIISHEHKFHIWNYWRIKQYRIQGQENVTFFSFLNYVNQYFHCPTYLHQPVNHRYHFMYWFFKKLKENFTLPLYIEREIPITKLCGIIWVLIWRRMAWDLIKFKTVIQDHKLNHSFMSACYLITHLIPHELIRK